MGGDESAGGAGGRGFVGTSLAADNVWRGLQLKRNSFSREGTALLALSLLLPLALSLACSRCRSYSSSRSLFRSVSVSLCLFH